MSVTVAEDPKDGATAKVAGMLFGITVIVLGVGAMAFMGAMWKADVDANDAVCRTVGGTYRELDRTQDLTPMCRMRDGSFKAMPKPHPQITDAFGVMGSWLEDGAASVVRTIGGVVETNRHRGDDAGPR